MKKIVIGLLVIIALFGGYLAYDWHSVAAKRTNAPMVDIYSWKDADGTVHFSDKTPPPDALDIHKTQGQAYVAPPLIIRMKQTVAEWFGKAKEGLSKRSDKRSRRRSKK